MTLRLLPRLFLYAACASTAVPAVAQTAYDGSDGGTVYSVGGGLSNFDPAFAQGPAPAYRIHTGLGQGRLWGATGWADVRVPNQIPFLSGIGIEAQIRSVFAAASSSQKDLNESTLGVGATYTWRHFHTWRPYAKYVYGFGVMNFAPVPEGNGPPYYQDSRATNSVGGGLEFRCSHRVWARFDYEYQVWGNLFGGGLRPQGLTVGAMYSLRRFHGR